MDNIRAIYLTLEKLIQPEETQVNGIVILVDYTGVGLSQASNPGPLLAKKVVSILQVSLSVYQCIVGQIKGGPTESHGDAVISSVAS